MPVARLLPAFVRPVAMLLRYYSIVFQRLFARCTTAMHSVVCASTPLQILMWVVVNLGDLDSL